MYRSDATMWLYMLSVAPRLNLPKMAYRARACAASGELANAKLHLRACSAFALIASAKSTASGSTVNFPAKLLE